MGLGWVFLEVSASKGDVGQGRWGGEQSPVHVLLLRESKSPAGMPCWPLSHTVLGSVLKIVTNHPKHPPTTPCTSRAVRSDGGASCWCSAPESITPQLHSYPKLHLLGPDAGFWHLHVPRVAPPRAGAPLFPPAPSRSQDTTQLQSSSTLPATRLRD